MKPVEVIKALNAAWRDSEAGTIAAAVRPLLSDDVVVVGPDLVRVPLDADAAARSFDDFKANAVVLTFELGEPSVDEFGDVAVGTVQWSMNYEFAGIRSSERGHEVYVLRRTVSGWKICWRQIVSMPA